MSYLSHYISPWSFCDDFPTPSHDGEVGAKSPRPLQCLIFCLDDHLHRIVIDLASCAQDLLVTGDFSRNSKPPCSWIEWRPHSRNLLLVFLYTLWNSAQIIIHGVFQWVQNCFWYFFYSFGFFLGFVPLQFFHGFLQFFHGFLQCFHSFLQLFHGFLQFSMVFFNFPLFSASFPWCSSIFPLVSSIFPGFSSIFPWFSNGFLQVFHGFLQFFHSVLQLFHGFLQFSIVFCKVSLVFFNQSIYIYICVCMYVCMYVGR